jgi:hypothetical protein
VTRLVEEAVVNQYLTNAADGKNYNVKHNLQAIIAVGFKIENERAVQFRKWATQAVKDYTIQRWVMDVDRLKSGGSVLTQEFFDRQRRPLRLDPADPLGARARLAAIEAGMTWRELGTAP